MASLQALVGISTLFLSTILKLNLNVFSSDIFVQHDVQELNRVLCDKLEEKMKGKLRDDDSRALQPLQFSPFF